jgi:transposase
MWYVSGDPLHCSAALRWRLVVSKSLFWLSDEAWAVFAPHQPQNQPGARRVDDRRVVSGIVHMRRSGVRWRDGPAAYGPCTTICNR